MRGAELLRHLAEEVRLDLGVAELLEGHLDLAADLAAAAGGRAGRLAAAGTPAAGGEGGGGTEAGGSEKELASAHVSPWGRDPGDRGPRWGVRRSVRMNLDA